MIAPGKGEGFADIFEGNAFQSGLLPIELDRRRLARPSATPRAPTPGAEATIDLAAQTVTLHPSEGNRHPAFPFDIPEAHRNRLLQGLDAIAETLLDEPQIRAFEAKMPAWVTPQAASR